MCAANLRAYIYPNCYRHTNNDLYGCTKGHKDGAPNYY